MIKCHQHCNFQRVKDSKSRELTSIVISCVKYQVGQLNPVRSYTTKSSQSPLCATLLKRCNHLVRYLGMYATALHKQRVCGGAASISDGILILFSPIPSSDLQKVKLDVTAS